VEPDMYDYTSYNWSHWNGNEKLREKSGSYTRKSIDRFTTADSCTGNITQSTEKVKVKAAFSGFLRHRDLCSLLYPRP
jgi:hypothetical protein